MIERTQSQIMQNWAEDNINTPVVSVRCLTFNHELYIEQALDGFLMQETNFPFEVVVHDDASTDRTADIIRQYESKYSKIIKPIYEIENQYSKHDGSITRIVNAALKGKYIAICEGDDYWTDPLKLQKQVNFLEANPDFSLCFHRRDILENGQLRADELVVKKDVWEINEAMYYCVPTQTVMYRNLPHIFPKRCISLDATMWLSLSRYGKFKFLDFVGAVYRIHKGGMWNGSSPLENYNRSINARTSCFWHMKGIDRRNLAIIIGNWLVGRFEWFVNQKQYFKAILDATRIVLYSFYGCNLDNMRKVKYFLIDKYYNRKNLG